MVSCQKINGLVVRGFKKESEIPLPGAYSRDEIPVKRSQIPRPESVFGWPHLERIADKLMPYRDDVDVGLLIGVNCARAIKPCEVIPGSDEDPYAKRTNLGWGVIGTINLDKHVEDDGHCSCNRIISREIGEGSSRTVSHFVMKTQFKEVFGPTQVNRMFELDFNETIRDDQALSFQDKKFLNIVTTNIRRREDRHYEMPLPLNEQSFRLPDNKNLAVSRLMKLKQRLTRDGKYREHYQAFMHDMIEKGHAESVPSEELHVNNGRTWYIPHHGVYHPQKLDKIRVVFDASAEFNGESLNPSPSSRTRLDE